MSAKPDVSLKQSTEYAVILDPNAQIDDVFNREIESPAKEFPFKLDSFQMQAILHLERHSNVLVSAHTSAGKTVVADYAIAMAFRSMSRVIYTSPIKALSNQKFRDFKDEFKEVGLLTGDVQIDSESKCLIMTTEILLQMLYNRSEVLYDLEWVVFDECHYVNDPERGHVWEEIFILLPESVNLVLLSATVPNVVQFADWLGRARKKKTHVVYTTKRPVPLQHYLYVLTGGKNKSQQLMIVDEEGKFNKDNYKEAEDLMKERKGMLGYIKRCPQTERQIYLTLIRHLADSDKLPAICFTLSRNRCDTNLENLMAISEESFQLTTREEMVQIRGFVKQHLSRLKDCDKKLPQVIRTVEMLKRGLGVHHSGILPILKEITEILFSQGLVKVLVATETFAMGVNMPARTVVFDSIEKHDGINWRDLKPSEYIQMAGRAGRRGKDKTGNVLILCKYDIPDSPRLNKMMQGSATELVSQFRLTYHMICNLHKSSERDDNEIETFLERSFGEHNRVLKALDLTTKLETLKTQFETFPSLECEICLDIEVFYECLENCRQMSELVMPSIVRKAIEKGRLSSGRIIAIVGKDNPFESALVVRVNRGQNNKISSLTVLSLKEKNDFEYKTIELNSIHKILNKQLKKFDSKSIIEENENPKTKNRKDYKSKEETMNAIERLRDLSLENDYTILNVESIDPKKNLQINEIGIFERLDQFLTVGQSLVTFNCIKCTDFVKHFTKIREKMLILNQIKELEHKLSTNSLQFMPEYNSRIKVLQTLDYLNEHMVLQLKGRIACLMSEHELVITEMLTNNLIHDMTAEEIAALLSCFVCQQKSKDKIEKIANQKLEEKKVELQYLARDMAEIEKRCGVPDQSVQACVDLLKFDLVDLVYEWAKGKPFVDVLPLSSAQEGIIVRCIQRLDELLKYIKLAAKLMGSNDLEEKIESASQAIRRDIVFSPSLYTIVDTQTSDKENDNTLDESLNSNFL